MSRGKQNDMGCISENNENNSSKRAIVVADAHQKAELIYSWVINQVQCGDLREGEKLPSELEFCRQFDVSRVTVRRAMHKLQGLGLVRTHQGQGSFITDAVSANISRVILSALDLSESEYREFMDFRKALEFGSIELAAQWAQQEDFERINTAYEKMLAFGREEFFSESSIEADYQFHLSIIAASKNMLFYKVVYDLKEVYMTYENRIRLLKGGKSYEKMMDNHLMIMRAIADRDAKRAIWIIKNSMEFNYNYLKPIFDNKG